MVGRPPTREDIRKARLLEAIDDYALKELCSFFEENGILAFREYADPRAGRGHRDIDHVLYICFGRTIIVIYLEDKNYSQKTRVSRSLLQEKVYDKLQGIILEDYTKEVKKFAFLVGHMVINKKHRQDIESRKIHRIELPYVELDVGTDFVRNCIDRIKAAVIDLVRAFLPPSLPIPTYEFKAISKHRIRLAHGKNLRLVDLRDLEDDSLVYLDGSNPFCFIRYSEGRNGLVRIISPWPAKRDSQCEVKLRNRKIGQLYQSEWMAWKHVVSIK